MGRKGNNLNNFFKKPNLIAKSIIFEVDDKNRDNLRIFECTPVPLAVGQEGSGI